MQISDPHIDGMAASQLVSAASFSALITALRRKGIFTDSEITAIYKEALILLEIDQSEDPETNTMSKMAIHMLRVQLGVEDNDT